MGSNPVKSGNSMKSEVSRLLSELLAQEPDWPMPSRLRLTRRLAEEVVALYDAGRTHRCVEVAEVVIDARSRPTLGNPLAACAQSDSLATHPTQAMPQSDLPEEIEELISARIWPRWCRMFHCKTGVPLPINLKL